MDSVGAALGDRVDDPACGCAVLGGEVAGVDGELAEGVKRRADHVALLVVKSTKIVDVACAVEEEGVLQAGVAVGDEGVVAAGSGGDDAWDVVRCVEVVTAIEGDVGDLFGTDDLRVGFGVVFDERSS